jgi:hypothetical protein
MELQRAKAEPAYKAELTEERKRREQLESRLNDLVQENQRARQRAEEVERTSAIRNELQRLGVAKVDIAFRAVKDDIVRTDDGQLKARTAEGEQSLREYLAQFVTENPELRRRDCGRIRATLSARSGGSGSSAVDLDRSGRDERGGYGAGEAGDREDCCATIAWRLAAYSSGSSREEQQFTVAPAAARLPCRFGGTGSPTTA